ncbi:MAG: hypothetical protein CM15mP59_6800 [Flavobacteriaceae bacterium]|nr:MAG: hypothetical protein CM15mP59_6800 [Flavobacteriaceae bacterium]
MAKNTKLSLQGHLYVGEGFKTTTVLEDEFEKLIVEK